MTADGELLQVRALVRGIVQGVGFRATAAHVARQMQLAGTVRNLPDGSVEIIVQGTRRQIADFFEGVKKNTFGRIDEIEQEIQARRDIFVDFKAVH